MKGPRSRWSRSGPNSARHRTFAARSVGASAIAVANDIRRGPRNIHPHNKQEGRAAASRSTQTRDRLRQRPSSTPDPSTSRLDVKDDKVHAPPSSTSPAGPRRQGRRPPSKGFAVAGEDKKFSWADAEDRGRHGDRLPPAQVPHPTAVSATAWGKNNPAKANLYNRAGLPRPPPSEPTAPG